eukprot:gene6057-6295_t
MPQTLWNEDVQLEVEALQATFDNLSVNDSQHTISMRVTPTGSIVANPQEQDEESCFVDVVLQLAFRQGYPLAAPEILLRDSHGLGSARLADLQQHLQQEADALLGEMMIGHLFDKAARKCICAPGTTVAPGGLSCMGTKIREPGEFGTYCKSDKDCKAGVCNRDQKVCMCPRSQFISPDGSTCITQEELCASGGKLPSLDVDLTHIYNLACGKARPAGTSGPGNASSAAGGGKVASGNLTGTSGNITAAGMARPKSCKDGNPCENDGVCVVAPGTALGYTCDCFEMFSGTWCESYVINTCSTFNPCANGGVCVPAYGKAPDFTCSCAEGVSGDRCQVTSTACSNGSSPCQNGGECYPAPGQVPDYTCGCAQGFAGNMCELNCAAEGLVPDEAGRSCTFPGGPAAGSFKNSTTNRSAAGNLLVAANANFQISTAAARLALQEYQKMRPPLKGDLAAISCKMARRVMWTVGLAVSSDVRLGSFATLPLTFPFSPVEAYDKNITYRSGRCPARAYMSKLLPLVQQKAWPFTDIITHRLPLTQGVEAYQMFDQKLDGCIKVVLDPWHREA